MASGSASGLARAGTWRVLGWAQQNGLFFALALLTAFFALSNRMANVTSMKPNDEFYMMGRLPK